MSSAPSELPTLGFIGGTGPEGRGLGLRFASLGYRVVIGSRAAERAQQIASDLLDILPKASIRGASNGEAASMADVIVLTIPFAGAANTLPHVAEATGGKIVISSIAPIEFREGRPVALRVECGSAAQEVQRLLPNARVVSAFQTVDAHQLCDLSAQLDTDVIVCSDDQDARHEVIALAGRLGGVRALSGGRLAASRYVEEVTTLLITLNRIYKAHSGVRFTGIHRT